MRRNKTLDERFTALADKVSIYMGVWQTTVVALIFLLIWISLGAPMNWSDTWQLMANTPTTWLELFIGFLLAAAANRSQRQLEKILKHLTATVQRDERLEQRLINLLHENTELTKAVHTLTQEIHQRTIGGNSKGAEA